MKQTFSTHMVPSTEVLFHRDTTYLTKDGWRRGANESLYHVGYYQPQGGENSPRDTALSSHEHLLMHIPPGVYCPGELSN